MARKGGAVVGCIGLRVRGRIGEVTRVFVVPSERRNGIGAKLVAEIEAVARKCNVGRLELDTRDDLVEARRLYEHCGFEEVPAFNGTGTRRTGLPRSSMASVRARSTRPNRS